MLHFECDYACGAAAPVLEALVRTNSAQSTGYGVDEYCDAARRLILSRCGDPDADVHFFVGGTQVNLTVIAAALRPFEGVLCADTGHINVHETGSVEATGHKVIGLANTDGKITAAQVETAFLTQQNDGSYEHIVRPGMVYISHPTESGTLYSRSELEALSAVCRRCGLPLFLDGARLGYGLAADPAVDLPFLARVCDAFTIGGTKQGLLFGEALVLTHPALRRDFRYHIKQRGAMLAKGRLLGVQFSAIFENDDYLKLSIEANRQADRIRQCFAGNGCPFFSETVTNQVFPIVPDRVLEKLSADFCFSSWARVDESHTAARFCTNVTTSPAEVDALISAVNAVFAG